MEGFYEGQVGGFCFGPSLELHYTRDEGFCYHCCWGSGLVFISSLCAK